MSPEKVVGTYGLKDGDKIWLKQVHTQKEVKPNTFIVRPVQGEQFTVENLSTADTIASMKSEIKNSHGLDAQ